MFWSVPIRTFLVGTTRSYPYGAQALIARGQLMAANVSAVSDVPEPGNARRRHVRRPDTTNLHGTTCGGKAARTRGRCAK